MKILVDDALVATVSSRADLSAYAPRAAWRDIVAIAGPRVAVVERPNQLYAGQTATIDGAHFTLTRPIDPALPRSVQELAAKPTIELDGVTEIRIRTKERPVAASRGSIAVQRGATASAWTYESLESRAHHSARKNGIDVRDRIGHASSVKLVGAGGTIVTESREELARRELRVRINRKGHAHLRVWEGERNVTDIADLVRVEIAD